MRLERWMGAALALALAGCVTTTTETGSLGGRLPHTSKSQQAEDAARIHTELGQQYMANGDLKTAMEKLNRALQFDQDYAPAHTVLAVLEERINRPEQAEQHYRRAAQLEPDKGMPNNNLGTFLCRIGKGAEALGYFRKAVKDPFYPTPDVAWTNQGICQLHMHDLPGAEASLRKALDTNPKNGDALLQLANVLYLNNDAFRARAFIQRFEALGQPSAVALKLGHDIETRLGNTDAAHTYRRRLQGQFPDSEQARALDAPASP
ncbi:type IV pilus biogenesis/stability protein PilW [Frateuria sp. STR12]|uniref:type IV pilus biogenesis/stability protein PilW n=1 Tax=Frateuria hangzhouensis TaxID=2995589 RepID=UPI002261005A|nr:type IV pilus biogenesis/stability protein PilW [Frateuria sp. STR12]MCX7512175.1 type IV pilus biogenesis/stability protein PilW [Frateuria sp. STR12]